MCFAKCGLFHFQPVVVLAAVCCFLHRFSRHPPRQPPPPHRTQKRSIYCTFRIQTPSLGRICPFYDAHQSAASPRSILIIYSLAPETRSAALRCSVLPPPPPPPHLPLVELPSAGVCVCGRCARARACICLCVSCMRACVRACVQSLHDFKHAGSVSGLRFFLLNNLPLLRRTFDRTAAA